VVVSDFICFLKIKYQADIFDLIIVVVCALCFVMAFALMLVVNLPMIKLFSLVTLVVISFFTGLNVSDVMLDYRKWKEIHDNQENEHGV